MIGVRSIKIKAEAAKASSENFFDRNERLGRPSSPHLSIYAFQITSVLSITHRMTGVALTGYAATLGIGALILPHDFSYYVSLIESLKLSVPTLIAVKYVLAFPVTFHTFNGIRHLFWDFGKFLTIKDVYTTGYAMLAASIITASILSVV